MDDEKQMSRQVKNRDKLTRFKEVHKDLITQPIKCPLCRGSYTYFNKSSHFKTQRHQDFISAGGNLSSPTTSPPTIS